MGNGFITPLPILVAGSGAPKASQREAERENEKGKGGREMIRAHGVFPSPDEKDENTYN